MGFKNPKPGSSETKFLIAVNKLTLAIAGRMVKGKLFRLLVENVLLIVNVLRVFCLLAMLG